MSRRSCAGARPRPPAAWAPAACLGAVAGVLLFASCTGGGVWEVSVLERRVPALRTIDGHRLGDATPYLLPARGAVAFFLCRWPDTEPIPLVLPARAETLLRSSVDRAARAWEQALGVRFARREALSGQGIEIRFADPRAANAALAGHAIADCRVDAIEEARSRPAALVPARLTGASIVLRRVHRDALGREIALTEEELVGAALHEIGHALGYSGHAGSGHTVMVRSVDDVRRAGRRLLAGERFRDPTLQALYSVPSGTVVGWAELRASVTRDIDALRDRAPALDLAGPFVNVGDDLARISWKRRDGRDFPFLIFDPRGVTRDPARMVVVTLPRTRELLRESAAGPGGERRSARWLGNRSAR